MSYDNILLGDCFMHVESNFKNYYLTVGSTYDNFIFENCSLKFIEYAYKCLNDDFNNIKSCCIVIDNEMEKKLNILFDMCDSDYQKKLLSRTFFITLFVCELLKNTNIMMKNMISFEELKDGLEIMLSGDLEMAKKYYLKCPLPYDIKRIMDKVGKIELNVFLVNTSSVYLQSAINLFISSREPYSVKIFTNNERLPCYTDLNGILIEQPHDYMSVDVNKFIDCKCKNM